MLILGIETSCDETAAAVLEVKNKKIKVLSNIVSSQIKIHRKYGGVVPEVASREHAAMIVPVIDRALKQAKISSKKIDLIAVTTSPGLIGSLMVGIETAKALSLVWQIPIVGVNHIKGHIYSVLLDNKIDLDFPALVLTVSGGHTNLILMRDFGKYKIIGKTLDDAAGEAFDKGAKMLGLSYPGGPEISRLAALAKNNSEINLPRPMLNSKDFNFSFSGLKTALLYKLKKDKNWKEKINNYCFEFEEAIVDVLVKKTIKAAEKLRVKEVLLVGGVSANQKLRKNLAAEIKEKLPDVKLKIVDLKYSGDNAAMIAAAGYFNFKQKKPISWNRLKADCNLFL